MSLLAAPFLLPVLKSESLFHCAVNEELSGGELCCWRKRKRRRDRDRERERERERERKERENSSQEGCYLTPRPARRCLHEEEQEGGLERTELKMGKGRKGRGVGRKEGRKTKTRKEKL
jgi:hypothetical protein